MSATLLLAANETTAGLTAVIIVAVAVIAVIGIISGRALREEYLISRGQRDRWERERAQFG